MSFNYRVFKYEKEGYGIHEVHYDENNKISSCSEEACVVGNDLEDLKGELENIQKAFDKDIINEADLLETA